MSSNFAYTYTSTILDASLYFEIIISTTEHVSLFSPFPPFVFDLPDHRHSHNCLQVREVKLKLYFSILFYDKSSEAFPSLYLNIAKCYEALNDETKSKEYFELANSFQNNPFDKGPFYHGTKADLRIGDLLTPGGNSNYKSEIIMNHIYFTALVNGAGLDAAIAKGEGNERVYIVEPTSDYENGPNLTDKKFPGYPTRSYRSKFPLKNIGEVTDWARPTHEELQKFRDKLSGNKGEIIN